MNGLLDWIDERTGLVATVRDWFQRPIAGGPAWRFVWPAAIVFGFVTEAITGLVLWMYYSPGAQTAWESVYYIQSQLSGGWLLRAIHYYTAQVMLVLVGVYLLQILVRGVYRAPREFLYWSVLLMGLMVLAFNLTGDLMPWDQNGHGCTQIRTGFLLLLPGVGESLLKLAIGGSNFGHLTLTRFVALHVGVFSAVMIGLLAVHAWLARRLGLETAKGSSPGGAYWPGQALRDAVACAAVLVVVLALCFQHGFGGENAGMELGAPANPAEPFAAARPEWSFRGLYEMTHLFSPQWQIVPVFGISGLVVGIFLLMPLIARFFPWGHAANLAFATVVVAGLVVLSWNSFARDRGDTHYQQALDAANHEAHRVKELARSPRGIPITGAITLVRNDPKTQGPRLFKQHCASCHDYVNREDDADPANIKADKPLAPNLYAFASRPWIAGLLDYQQIKGPHYFGNTKLRSDAMPGFVKETLSGLSADEKKEIQKTIATLSAEAGLKIQRQQDADDAETIKQGRKALGDDFNCVSCHRFQKKGQLGDGPDLTGYGSRGWLVGIISNPADKQFYGKRNDRMPAYAESPSEPGKNVLAQRDIELVADWLRGDWYEEGEGEQ